jgi:hypothetical protein
LLRRLGGGLNLVLNYDFDYVYQLVLVGVPPSPLSIKIIDLRGNFRQVFGFKGVNLQSIHNKGVIGNFLEP